MVHIWCYVAGCLWIDNKALHGKICIVTKNLTQITNFSFLAPIYYSFCILCKILTPAPGHMQQDSLYWPKDVSKH